MRKLRGPSRVARANNSRVKVHFTAKAALFSGLYRQNALCSIDLDELDNKSFETDAIGERDRQQMQENGCGGSRFHSFNWLIVRLVLSTWTEYCLVDF